MDFMTAIDIGASGLSAERASLNIISMNLANAKTTRTMEGGPYQRRMVIKGTTEIDDPFTSVMQDHLSRQLKGVRILGISRDSERFKNVFEPGHPDANEEGYVRYPDINVVEEMTNMLTSTRTYEANVASIGSIKGMWNKALELGR